MDEALINKELQSRLEKTIKYYDSVITDYIDRKQPWEHIHTTKMFYECQLEVLLEEGDKT